MLRERWSLLLKQYTTHLHCQAVTPSGVADCEQDVEWEFPYQVHPRIQDEHDYIPISYCDEHKKDRCADPKWRSLRRQLPGRLLRDRDFLAKAFRSVQPECHTCTSLSALINRELTNDLFTPAQQDHLARLQANRLLEHWDRAHKQEMA